VFGFGYQLEREARHRSLWLSKQEALRRPKRLNAELHPICRPRPP
jgi:hypothetical protein